MVATQNVKLAAFTTWHFKQISLPLLSGHATLLWIRELRALQLRENDYSTPTEDEKPNIQPKNWSKTIESIELWLARHLGKTKLPLSYVVRHNPIVPGCMDPRVGQEDSLYPTHKEEMVARAPIFVDNTAVTFTWEFAQATNYS